MERASFADYYINKTDHELQTPREKIMEMSPYELQTLRRDERTRIKAGALELVLTAFPNCPPFSGGR